MKYRLAKDQEHKIEQFGRSNFAQLFADILEARQNQIYEQLRLVLPEAFLKEQGRLLELDDLLSVLKTKGQE